MAYEPGAGYPSLAEIRAWIKTPATQLSDAELDVIASAEQTAQSRLVWDELELGVDLPADAVGAFYRRVARHAAAKSIPLGVLGADAEYGAVRLSRFDAEIERLEAPYVVPVVA